MREKIAFEIGALVLANLELQSKLDAALKEIERLTAEVSKKTPAGGQAESLWPAHSSPRA